MLVSKKKCKNIIKAICFIMLILSMNTLDNIVLANSIVVQESIQINVDLLRPKILLLQNKYNIGNEKMVKIIEYFIQIRGLSKGDEAALRYIIKELNTSIVKDTIQKNNKNSLPNHGRFSSKENILTYRLNYTYREKYLRSKDEDVLRSYIFKKDIGEKKVFLTFDDGPYNHQKELVDYIMEKKLPSTFFLICDKINERNIAPYRTEFITMGMHTNTHLNYDNLTKDQILNDIHACNLKFDKHKLKKGLFRPAFGITNRRESEVLSMNKFDGYIWSMDSFDRANGFNDARVQEMLDTISWGEIILFHENADVEMFKKFIDGLIEKGYSFGKL